MSFCCRIEKKGARTVNKYVFSPQRDSLGFAIAISVHQKERGVTRGKKKRKRKKELSKEGAKKNIL